MRPPVKGYQVLRGPPSLPPIIQLAATASRPPLRAPLRGGFASLDPAATHKDLAAIRKDGRDEKGSSRAQRDPRRQSLEATQRACPSPHYASAWNSGGTSIPCSSRYFFRLGIMTAVCHFASSVDVNANISSPA